LLAFRSVARENGCHFGLLDETVRVNEEQRNRFLRKVRKALWTLKGKKLAVLGLAFKNGTDDLRESPAVCIIHALLKEGCSVVAYDPAAMERAAQEFGPNSAVKFASGPYEALEGADACLVLTEWEDFSALDLKRIKSLLHYPIVVDGRNLFKPAQMEAAGLNYYSIGRPDVVGRDAVAIKTSLKAAAQSNEAA
jgi:UDPglucose 6-dehydrogenase